MIAKILTQVAASHYRFICPTVKQIVEVLHARHGPSESNSVSHPAGGSSHDESPCRAAVFIIDLALPLWYFAGSCNHRICPRSPVHFAPRNLEGVAMRIIARVAVLAAVSLVWLA